MNRIKRDFMLLAVVVSTAAGVSAQQGAGTPPATGKTPPTPAVPTAEAPPPDYVIGAGDVLAIVFWREPDMSTEVVVRPDGRISIPLLNDVVVTDLTPEQLRKKLAADAQRYVQDPNVTVVVKQINSRRVFITGQVAKPGPYPLTASMNVLQLISSAGGLLEYADGGDIVVMRNENGKTATYSFNYKEVVRRKNLKQNLDLKPGDTVIVP
ncbi:MAG TPA: polysaccharide biosynthesis/export family protein [Vicinamibacterales bacterium]|nr:polysaccharide biosynthesis/export family protein [Vicinamibacterales bacterium]